MRLNVKKYQEFMREQNIDKADIERMIGITVQTMDWIFENEYLEISTLERLAKVVKFAIRGKLHYQITAMWKMLLNG